MMRRLIALALAAISIGLLVAAWSRPVFWMVFVLPCISLILLQLIALSEWKGKEELFKYTDYVYYILIGAIVGLASRYLDQRDLVAKFEHTAEAISLEQNLKRLDGDLSRLRDMLKSAKPPVEKDRKMDSGILAACTFGEVMRREGMSPRQGLSTQLSAEYCDDYISRFVDTPAVLSDQIAKAEREREATRQQMSSIRGHVLNGDHSLTAAQEPAPEARFLWLPTLLLVGVTLKLGKTTSALCPVSKARPIQ